MDLSLETLLSDAGVEPTISSQLVSDGWTISSFREVVSDPMDFTDSLFDELCPGAAFTFAKGLAQERMEECSVELFFF